THYRLAKMGSDTDRRNARIAAGVGTIAGEIGHPASHVALAWIRQREPDVIPTVGAEKEDQIRGNLASLARIIHEDS
ncbi:MAG: hypothetical protein ACRDSJ_19880, partial [Rubrobacteraceae bacterium]